MRMKGRRAEERKQRHALMTKFKVGELAASELLVELERQRAANKTGRGSEPRKKRRQRRAFFCPNQ